MNFAAAPETVKKGLCPFLTKGLQSAARTPCPPTADNSHTCSLIGIFCQVHAPTENDPWIVKLSATVYQRRLQREIAS